MNSSNGSYNVYTELCSSLGVPYPPPEVSDIFGYVVNYVMTVLETNKFIGGLTGVNLLNLTQLQRRNQQAQAQAMTKASEMLAQQMAAVVTNNKQQTTTNKRRNEAKPTAAKKPRLQNNANIPARKSTVVKRPTTNNKPRSKGNNILLPVADTNSGLFSGLSSLKQDNNGNDLYMTPPRS